MEIIIIVLLSTVLLVLLILLLLVLKKQKSNPGLTGDVNFDDLFNKLNNINESTRSELRENLSKIYSDTQAITNIKEDVNNLNNLFLNNNRTGKVGEALLDRYFGNLSTSLQDKGFLFEQQYTLKKKDKDKGLIIDYLIKGNTGNFQNLAIDSKFPADTYNNYIKESNSDNKKSLKSSISGKIDECAKYISVEDDINFVIMFLPSDAIYQYIIENHDDLIEKAFSKNVIISGPSVLSSIIYSIEGYMKTFEKLDSGKEVTELISKIFSLLDKYSSHIEDMKKAIDTINKRWDEFYNSGIKELIKVKKLSKYLDKK